MDITIPRAMIEQRLKRAMDRHSYQQRAARMCEANNDCLTASWYDGAMYGTQREIDTLEILIEVADDMANNVYSIAR